MKNIINEKPSENLTGRLAESVRFVSESDMHNKKVLNVGCGYGWFELNAVKRNVKKIVGIEISEKDLKTAKESISDPQVKFQIGSAIDIPFENETFDTVVSWEVIEHIPKNTEEKMFAEVYRVLKPGGAFYLSTPFDNFWAKVFDPAWWLISHRHYSREMLSRFAEENEFHVEEIRIRGGWWNLLALLDMYISKWVFHRQKLFEAYFTQKEDEEFTHDTGFMTIFVKFKRHL